ncbi:glycosyltransferase [Sulfitobacter sp. MOLA879]|uniref:glycosyltransferase n=1 Tax=Sulfitobacter sp. MOLA879 TaxID=3368579 RepID=UPI003746BAB7
MPTSSVQIVTNIEDESSGPSYSVVRLAEALAARGTKSSVFSLANRPGTDERAGVEFSRFRPDGGLLSVPRQLSSSKTLAKAIEQASQAGKVLHVHGLWRMPNVYPGLAAARTGAPLVLSPRGMLGGPALAFSKLQKRLFWHIWQMRALRALNCVHVTAPSELEDIRLFGLTAPAAIIPNGIDVPEHPVVLDKRNKTVRQALHLGRIHPKKGIDRLLRAWSLINDAEEEWELRIVGPSERGYLEELRALAKQLNIRNIRFEGPIYGVDKQRAYAEADLFVLPTHHENFGMVVAEALAQGTPVICSKGAPWEGLVSERCGWWVEHDPVTLAAAISEAKAISSKDLLRMGSRGRDWMRRDFSWDAIAQKMESVYQWCQRQGDRPDCVVD